MKRTIQLVVAAFLLSAGLAAKADVSVFGNTTNNGAEINLIVNMGISVNGAAVEFTLSQNINLSSVGLWLSFYTRQSGQTLDLGIWNNSVIEPSSLLVNLTAPAPNDGSTNLFIFSNPSGSTTLLANTSYWLFLQPTNSNPSGGSEAEWLGGGTPTGEATYDGTQIYNMLNDEFYDSTYTPAFTINTVPEPGFGSWLSLFALSGAAWKYRRAKRDF